VRSLKKNGKNNARRRRKGIRVILQAVQLPQDLFAIFVRIYSCFVLVDLLFLLVCFLPCLLLRLLNLHAGCGGSIRQGRLLLCRRGPSHGAPECSIHPVCGPVFGGGLAGAGPGERRKTVQGKINKTRALILPPCTRPHCFLFRPCVRPFPFFGAKACLCSIVSFYFISAHVLQLSLQSFVHAHF